MTKNNKKQYSLRQRKQSINTKIKSISIKRNKISFEIRSFK